MSKRKETSKSNSSQTSKSISSLGSFCCDDVEALSGKTPSLSPSESPKSCSSIENNMIALKSGNEAMSIGLNGNPFYDFFAQEKIKNRAADQENREAGVIRKAKKPRIDAPANWLSLSLNQADQVAVRKPKKAKIDPRADWLSLSLPYSDTGSLSEACGDMIESNVAPIATSNTAIDAPPLYSLNVNPQEVEWTVKKILTEKDCDAQSRLTIKKRFLEDHILPHLDGPVREEVKALGGLRVDVYDCDKHVWGEMVLKIWPSTMSRKFDGSWKSGFVDRRSLEAGDEVRFSWDKYNNRLLFSVLKKVHAIN